MKTEQLKIRDPYVYAENGMYYPNSSGGNEHPLIFELCEEKLEFEITLNNN